GRSSHTRCSPPSSAPRWSKAGWCSLLPDRYTAGGEEGRGIAQYRGVSPGYFRTLGIPLLRGRGLEPRDSATSPGVVVLNETAVRHYFPGQDPIGKHITIGLPDMPEQADPGPREVIGVVRDVREIGLASEAPDLLYVPLAQVPPKLSALVFGLLPMCVVMRGEGSAGALTKPVESVIRAYDPNLPVTSVRTMDEILSGSIGSRLFNMMLLGTLAALALVLATVGVYSVLAYLVARRTREIGIRLALGGDRPDIHRLVLRQGFLPVGIGIVLGLLGALASTRALVSLLYGVSTNDPVSIATVLLLMTAVGMLASYFPARRASRLNPVEALRHD
ncbi:MAG TPA: FtsX-like permease family protein, partial [Thermoanaerobaculia bacterium]|nr:FtsX-like permease family protein [Thermoanaerobaculia bacterium]